MAPKCLICSKVSQQTFLTNEKVLGKNLSSIITNISRIQLDGQKPKVICQNCAVSLIQADSVVDKLNQALSKYPRKLKDVKDDITSVESGENDDSHDESQNKMVNNFDRSELIDSTTLQNGVFQCDLCEYTANRTIFLKKHLMDKHDVEKPKIYKCDKCSASYQRPQSLKRHFENIHQKKLISSTPVKQQDAKEMLDEKQNSLKKHTKENVKLDTSNIANKSSNNEQTSLSVSNLSFQCDHCPYNSANVKGFKKHLQIKHQIEKPRIFKCMLCAESYQLKHAFIRHMETKHQQNPSIKTADKVSEIKLNSNEYQNNFIENDEILKKCPYCQKSFLTEEKYLIHVRKETCNTLNKSIGGSKKRQNDDNEEQNGSTSIYYETIDLKKKEKKKKQRYEDESSSNLEHKQMKKKLKHDLYSAEEIVYLCYLCPFKINNVESYKEHLSTTHQIQKCGINLCSQCLKSYPTTKLLRQHFKHEHMSSKQKTDQREEQHTCFICSKHFSQLKELRAHINDWHDVIKICPNCGKVFRSGEKLQSHIFGEKCKTSIYPCQDPYCNKRFSRLSKVREHMLKMHESHLQVQDEIILSN